jgi:hypothetical protein
MAADSDTLEHAKEEEADADEGSRAHGLPLLIARRHRHCGLEVTFVLTDYDSHAVSVGRIAK